MRRLTPPTSLEGEELFAVIWDPGSDSYVLSLRDGRSYDIGAPRDALTYLRDTVALGELGVRAMDSARNFYTAVVIPEEGRCFGADVETPDPDVNRLLKSSKHNSFVPIVV